MTKCSKVSIQSLLAERKALDAGWHALVHEAHAAATSDDVVNCESDTVADVARSFLTYFAAEVESELDAIDVLLQQLAESVRPFASRVLAVGSTGRSCMTHYCCLTHTPRHTQKERFLVYFDEQDTNDELDQLLQHIAHFADAFAFEQQQQRHVDAIARAFDNVVADAGASKR